MIKIDDRNIKQLEQTLKDVKFKAFPFATKATLNGIAFKAMGFARGIIKRDMISRNKYTEKSVLFEPTKTLNLKRQMSVVGSIAPYMELQEFGGTKRKKGKHGVPIATSYSSGEGEEARPRTKLPTRGNKLKNIKLLNRRTSKQNLIIKVGQAVRTGRRHIFLNFGKGKKRGIYKVVGGRSVKRGWPGNAKLKMIWDLSETSVRVPKSPWMQPAVKRTEPFAQKIYEDALKFQLKRLGMTR